MSKQFEEYNGPTGGHGEPSKGFTGHNHIVCDYCKKVIYTESQSYYYEPKHHIHLADETDICLKCARELQPNLFTENGWPINKIVNN